MTTLARRLGTTILAALLLGAAAGDASAAPRSFYGVASQTFLEPREIERMGDGGVGSLRSILSWASVEPRREGDYDWSGFDSIVAAAARNRITILPFVFGTPEWVARRLDGRRCGSRCELYAPRTKPARAVWREFVGAAVDRYGPQGKFWSQHPQVPREPIRAWQIWNEQNSASFYAPRPNARAYAKLLGAAAKAIRSRDRGADVVLGGMAGLEGARGATSAWTYLRNVYRRGAKRSFDGVAVHPYGAKLEGVREQVGRFRAEMRRAGDGGASLWVTEIGWGSARGGNPLNLGRSGQARRLGQAYRYFERRRHALNVKVVTWFSWRDSPVSICDWCASSGLFTRSLKPKPAWRTFKRQAPGR